MVILIGYCIISIVIAISATVDILHPVIKTKEMYLDTRVIYYLTFFILALLVAPLLFLACVHTHSGLMFRLILEEEVFSDK